MSMAEVVRGMTVDYEKKMSGQQETIQLLEEALEIAAFDTLDVEMRVVKTEELQAKVEYYRQAALKNIQEGKSDEK